MIVAVLLRGRHLCNSHVHGTTGRTLLIDYAKTRATVREHAIRSLREHGHTVDVYVSSYASPVQMEVVRFFGARCARFADPSIPGSSQSRCMRDGLELIPDGVYDAIVVVRIDLELACSLAYLLPPQTDVADRGAKWVTLLWREPDARAVADCVHVISGAALTDVAAALDECPVQRDMHWILPHLTSRSVSVRYAYPERCYDSNTDNEGNPVYRIVRTSTLQAVCTRPINR
jgi:hypothetical protein